MVGVPCRFGPPRWLDRVQRPKNYCPRKALRPCMPMSCCRAGAPGTSNLDLAEGRWRHTPGPVGVAANVACSAPAVCRPRKVVRMEHSDLGTGPRLATRPAPRFSRTMAFPITMAVFAASMALCGASGASALASSPAATARAKPGAAKVYIQRSGMGNKELAPVTVPSGSTVAWKFDCQNAPKHRGTFVLSSKEQGRSAVNLTDQTGLGGGGQKPVVTGRYGFAVNTSCGWDLTIESTPHAAG